MILATSELKKIAYDIIDGLNESDIKGSSIDLSIDNIIKVPKGGIIDLFETNELEDIYEEVELSKGFILEPNNFIYASTVEKIKIPSNMCGIIFPRSSFARIGLTLPNSMYANPSYEGHLPIVIHNHSPYKIKIPPYIKVVQLLLSEIKGEAIAYDEDKNSKYINENRIQDPIFDDINIDEMMKWLKDG